MREFPIAIAIVAAASLAGSLAGCGSSPSSSQAASTQAASAQTPTTTAPVTAAPVTAAPVTTAPATQASAPAPDAPPTTNPATTMVTWCGPVSNVVQYSSLDQWKTGTNFASNLQDSLGYNIQGTVRAIENLAPNGAAASVFVDAQALCGEVREAYQAPPPADLGDYETAMANFLQASAQMRSVPGGTAASTEEAVRPNLNAGTTALNAFLAAIGGAPSGASARVPGLSS